MAKTATIILSLAIAIVSTFGMAAGPVHAAQPAQMDDPFEITADEILYDDVRGLYVANRNVRIVQGDRTLHAEWVAFSRTTRLGVAEGSVELFDAGEELFAEFMVFDVDSLQGMLYQGSLDAGSQGFQVQAKEMIRTGKNTFEIRDAIFTTCRCEEGEPVPWAIRAREAKVELGGYGRLTNSTFQVLGVPVLWIPWAIFPIKSERETGLLLPDFAFGGRGGLNFGLPFFWAAHPQLNVTLTPRFYTERGFKLDGELEYVFGKRSEGEFFVGTIQDQQAARENRWAVLWKHDQDLPFDWRWQTDLKLASDNLYSDDFQELRDFNANRYLESTSNFSRSFGDSGGVGAMVGARFADDVQGSSATDRDDYLLQRFAELRSDVQAGTLSAPLGLDARLDSELIYFAGLRDTESSITRLNPNFSTARPLRTDGRFFDLGFDGRFDPASFAAGAAGDFANANGENDGVFQPGEPLADRGARLILHPRIARPFQLGSALEVVPEIGWHQTLYRTDAQQFAERGLITARTDLRTRLARDYASDDGGRLRHLIEPRLGWAFVSDQKQKQNPLFVPKSGVQQTRLRMLNLENITRDPSDRIDSTNQVVFGLTQRFYKSDGPRSPARLRGELITAANWDFADGNGFGNIVAEGRIFPTGPLSLRASGAFDPEAVAFEEGGAGVVLDVPRPTSFFRRTSLRGGYRYLRRPPRFFETDVGNTTSFLRRGESELNQVDFEVQVEIAWRLRFTYAAIYGLANDTRGFIRNRGMLEYVSKCRCWGVGVRIDHETRDGIQGGFMIRFLGLGDERSNLFDGGLGAGINL